MTDYKRLFSVMLKLSRIRLQTNFRNENHYGFNVSTGLSIYFYRIDNEAEFIWSSAVWQEQRKGNYSNP